MAAASMFPVSNNGSPKVVSAPIQKKILHDVLDCIIQLKADFFENNQPITDDNVVLQRFCAKFEHLIQVGMKEKTSLLGRKKDYWDYFCECLASAKGSNDGIKYVKSLGENKTSLGRGRAYIRFCLVHQRLADTLQQCVVHEKTLEWFMPSSVLLQQKNCQSLINSLYDLNSLHFDLSPRGYDLDTAWPSFANRKAGASGSWNVPISRKSSITSMDTISQISMSVDHSEMDKLTKDLEVAQGAKNDLIGQIDVLQQEKQQVSQSAWATQGELQALQQQLTQLQSEHAALQERFKELDVSHMKLKLEKEHMEKLHKDEVNVLNEKFREEETKRISQLQSEEEIWKKEVKEESERRKREIDRLQGELKTSRTELEDGKQKVHEQQQALKTLLMNVDVKGDSDNFESSISNLAKHVEILQNKVQEISSEKASIQTSLQGEQSEKDKQLSHLEGRLTEMERALKDSKEAQIDLHSKLTASDLELKSEREKLAQLQQKESELLSDFKNRETELESVKVKIADKETQNSEYQQKIENLEKERNKLLENAESSEGEKEKLKCDLDNVEQNLRQLNDQMQERYVKISELSQTMEESTGKTKTLEAEIGDLKQSLQKKEEEITTLQKSADGQTSELQELLKKKDEMYTEILAQLDKTKEELALVSKETEEVGKGNLVLTESLSAAESQIETLKTQHNDEAEKVVALEMGLEEMTVEARKKDASLEEMKGEYDGLKAELNRVKENLDATKITVDKLTLDLRASETEKDGFKTELTQLQVERENLKRDMDLEKNRIMGLLKESEGAKRSEGEKAEKISSLIIELEDLRKEKEEVVADLEQKLATATSNITEKDKQTAALSAELRNLQIVLAETLSKYEQEQQILISRTGDSESKLKEVIAKLESDTVEMKVRHENETASFSERISYLESKVEETEKLLERKCSDYETKIEELNANLANLTSSSTEGAEFINKLNSELASLTEERDHLLTQTDAALEDAQQIKFQLTETSEQLALSYSQLETITAEKLSLTSEVTAMSEAITKVQDEKESLERAIAEMRQALKKAEDESQDKLSEKRGVEQQLEDLKVLYNKIVAEKSDLEKEVEGYQTQTEFSTKVLEETLTETKNALESLSLEHMELQERGLSMEKDTDELKTQVSNLEEERRDLLEQRDNLKKQIPSQDVSDISKLKEELEEEKRKHAAAVETLQEEISALQFQLSAEQMQSSDIPLTGSNQEESSQELRSRISELEIIIEELEEELSTVHKTKTTDSTQMQTNLLHAQELKTGLEAKTETCNKLEAKLQQVESKLAETASRKEKLEGELTHLRCSHDKDIEERDAAIKGLQSDNEQIKKKMVKLIKDKDTLWQKTDQLVTEQKRKVAERWQDNSTVIHCRQCKTEFSLFVRKHHCRLCGKIYCWACSDYWLDSPQSSKKVRVCKPCFDHHNDLGAALQSTSMIDNESDDDDGDEDDDQVEHSSASSRSSSKAGVVTATHNQTDEGKMRQKDDRNPSSSPDIEAVDDGDNNFTADGAVGGADGDSTQAQEEDVDDAMFHFVDQESVIKSIQAYTQSQPKTVTPIPPNMSTSIVLNAEELESGEVNKQNEVWIKPGKTFAVPIDIEAEQTLLHWEFTSQPKDIVFSVNFRSDDSVAVADAEEIVAPCKCDSHKQTVRGELTAKKPGIYTLLFDNTYSRMTSKKVHYSLEYKKQL